MKYLQLIYKLFHTRPVLLYLFIFFLFGFTRLAMLPWDPIGLPDDHDEFSNLLQAQTFSQGRISNPAPPLPEHFESFHILQTPTYASKYPPGQAFFLFIGIELFGHPWFGVLLSCMLMASCIVWMVNGYTETKWALMVGIFIVLRYTLWNYWSSSYWGGAVAAMGGALVFGALPRFLSKNKLSIGVASLCLGLGLSILSQTRPFEGLVVSILPVFFVGGLLIKRARQRSYHEFATMVLPAATVLLLNVSFITYYNYRITGDYLKMPYMLHSEQYSVQAPLLILNNKRSIPEYHHQVFDRHYNDWEIISIGSVKDYLILKRQHFRRFINFFFYWPFLLVLTIWFIYSKSIKIPYWSLIFFCLVLLVYPWFHPHYFAAIVPVYYLLLILGIAYLINHRKKLVRTISRVSLPIFLLITLVNSKHFANRFPGYINGTQEYVFQKQKIEDELSQTNAKHLIIVKYSDHHPLHQEWVYNGPDLTGSQIIWARYMTEEKNQNLMEYYGDRQSWLLEPDRKEIRLKEL